MKISAVMCVRNDNYGGNLADRASLCLNSYINSVDEVFLIDYNSPTYPLLWDIKENIEFKGNLKHIVITPETAKFLTNNDPQAQVCNEVISRNLGLRRASGDYMISTNIDIIAPKREDLELAINSNIIDQNTFYTISRRHTDWTQIKAFFKESEAKIRPEIILNERDLNFKAWPLLRNFLILSSSERVFSETITKGDDYSLINCCGDFQIAHKNVWNTIRGFEEDLIYTLYSDTNVQKKAVMHGFGLKALYSPALFHIEHGKGGGGFMDGINRKTNDMGRAVIFQHHTENKDTWGFSDIDVEYEVL